MTKLMTMWADYVEIFDGKVYRAILWPVQILVGCSFLIVYTVLMLAF